MKARTVEMGGDIALREFGPSSRCIDVLMRLPDVDRACLGLMLLDFELVDALILRARTSGQELVLLRGGDVDTGKWSKSECAIHFTHDSLGAILAFLLRFYRDSAAAVDHLDLDLHESGKGDGLTFILRADAYRGPMSGDEARELLSKR